MSETGSATDPGPKADTATVLAVERTQLAADRTLMAWVRTAFSMISFGFSLFKFFQFLREEAGDATISLRGPRNFGLLLIALGTVALVLASIDFARTRKRLAGVTGEKLSPWSLTLVVALTVALLGLLAYAGVAFRLGPLSTPAAFD